MASCCGYSLSTKSLKKLFNKVTETFIKDPIERGFNLLGFTDETVVTAFVGTNNIYADDVPFAYSFFNKTIKDVLENRDASNTLLPYLLTSPLTNVSSFAQYAVDSYPYGQPTSSGNFYGADDASVQSVLETIYSPDTIQIVSITSNPVTAENYAKEYIQQYNSYNYTTGAVVVSSSNYLYSSTDDTTPSSLIVNVTRTKHTRTHIYDNVVESSEDTLTLDESWVTNGDMESNIGWTEGTGWLIGSGVATKTAGTASDLSRDETVTDATGYTFSIDLTASAGSLSVEIDGNVVISSQTTTGTYTGTYTSADTTANIVIKADASFAGTVDNVRLVKTAERWKLTTTTTEKTQTQVTYTPATVADNTDNTVDGTPDVVVTYVATETNSNTNTTTSDNTVDTADNNTITGITGANYTDAYYTVVFQKNSITSQDYIWVYNRADGTYPSLDVAADITNVYADTLHLMPIISIREKGVSINSDTTDPLYIHGKAALDKIGIDFDAITQGIEDNPDKDLIDDVFILYGLNIYSDNQSDLKAIWEYYKDLESNQEFTKTDFDSAVASYPSKTPAVNSFTIEQGTFHNVIEFHYVDITEDIAGVIGTEGEYVNTITVLSDTTDDINTEEGARVNSYVTLQYQKTASTYDEIIVKGFIHKSYVVNDNTNIVSVVTTPLATAPSGEDQDVRTNFILPLYYKLLALPELTHREREELLFNSFKIVTYSSDYAELRYYETSKFLTFVNVITTTASIIYFGGQDFGASTFFISLFTNYVVSNMLAGAVALYADNPDAARFIAALAVGVSIGAGYYLGGGGALSTAETLLIATNAVLKTSEVYLQMEYSEILKEIEEFNTLSNIRLEELEAAKELLDNPLSLQSRTILDALIIDPSENPDKFYNRTVHSGNVGVQTLDQISNYYDNALMLPKNTSYFN